MGGHDVRLAWAFVAGSLAHISEFRGVPRGSRPRAECEVCGNQLTLRLGDQRAHHFAHRAGVDCSLNEAESARHYNTKQLLAAKLRATDELSVVTECSSSAGYVRCNRSLTALAAEGWDDVRVERVINPVRPDITLEKAGAPILAIEIHATHLVSHTKAGRLAELGIPWVEVEAGGTCDAWEPGTPLPAIRQELELAPKFCSDHSEPVESRPVHPPVPRVGRSSRVSSSASSDSHGERWRFRVVDCYPAHGPRVRKVFSVYCSDPKSNSIRLRLIDDDSDDSFVIGEFRAALRSREQLRKMNNLLRHHLKRTFELYDSPRRWEDSFDLPENLATLYRIDFMPIKYRRDANGAWGPI